MKTHGRSRTRLYNIWSIMKSRCSNPNHPKYPIYGGRGIAVCDAWKNDFETFEKWALSNGYDDSLTIDRIDNDGNYCPENCRWATYREQANNTRLTKHLTILGITKTVSEWSDITGVPAKEIHDRLYRGWSPEDAVFTPQKGKTHPIFCMSPSGETIDFPSIRDAVAWAGLSRSTLYRSINSGAPAGGYYWSRLVTAS